MKVVFHIDIDSTPTFELMLGNIRNLLRSAEAEVVVVANGYAVKLFTKPNLEKYAKEIEDLVRKGVIFYVCNNALTGLVNIGKEQISEFCEIIPVGIVKLIELQKKGYAYVKP
jgi:hypothetical protein